LRVGVGKKGAAVGGRDLGAGDPSTETGEVMGTKLRPPSTSVTSAMGRAIVAAAGDEAVTLEATSTETAGAGAGVGVGLEGADTGKAAAATVWVEAASVRVAAEEVPGAGDAADAEVAVEDEEAAVDAVVALSAAAAEEMALGSRFPGAMGGVGRRKREGGRTTGGASDSAAGGRPGGGASSRGLRVRIAIAGSNPCRYLQLFYALRWTLSVQ
jgi:hypothetical protein